MEMFEPRVQLRVRSLRFGNDSGTDEDEPPVCVVYLTDLDGSFPSVEPEYPVLWCVPEGSRSGSRPPPFGEIVAVK